MQRKFFYLSALIASALSAPTFAQTDAEVFQSVEQDAAEAKVNNAVMSTIASGNAFENMIPGLLNDHIIPGTAYNSDKKEFLNLQPITGKVVENLGDTRVQFETSNNATYDEVLRLLNGNVDVDVAFPVVRVNAGGHIAKEMASTDFSNTFVFQAYLTPKKRVFSPIDDNVGYTLSPVGQTLATQYQGQLMSMAGDSFIKEVEYGAQLLINMKIEYLSEQHKSEIGGYLGVDFAKGPVGVNVDGKLSYIDEDLKKSVRITVRALQKGGDPKQLLNVIPNNIITCSLDNYEPCTTLFQQAIEYARNDFESQFTSLSDYNVVRYVAVPYNTSTVDVRRLSTTDQEIRFETTYRTLWLEEQFKKSVNHEHRASSILSKYSSWMNDTQRTKSEQVKDAAYNNAWIYNEYATFCRDNPYGTACTDKWKDYENTCSASSVPCIENYSVSDLSVPAESVTKFFQCEGAREATANFGLVTNDTSLGYRNLSWAPTFIDADDPASGLVAWVPCKSVLPAYGSAFEQ